MLSIGDSNVQYLIRNDSLYIKEVSDDWIRINPTKLIENSKLFGSLFYGLENEVKHLIQNRLFLDKEMCKLRLSEDDYEELLKIYIFSFPIYINRNIVDMTVTSGLHKFITPKLMLNKNLTVDQIIYMGKHRVKEFFNFISWNEYNKICTFFIENGDLEMLIWLKSKNCEIVHIKRALILAAKNGHLEVFKWLRSNVLFLDPLYLDNICVAAVEGGNIKLIEWLEKNGFKFSKELRLCDKAAEKGDLKLFDFLYRKYHPIDSLTCATAAHYGHIKILERLQKRDCIPDLYSSLEASLNGHLDVLKWLKSNNYPWGYDVCYNAARRGDMEMIKWARSQNPPANWSEDCCHIAAENQHIDLLIWMLSQDSPCPCDERTFGSAVKICNLETLKRIRERDCPWDGRTFIQAAGRGDLEILKWLQEKDCPLNPDVYYYAFKFENLEVLRWLRSLNPPVPWSDKMRIKAAEYGIY